MIGIDVAGLIRFINSLGVPGLLVFALVGFYLEWWVFGREYRAVLKDRDEWRLLAQAGTHAAERSVAAAEQVRVP